MTGMVKKRKREKVFLNTSFQGEVWEDYESECSYARFPFQTLARCPFPPRIA